MMKKFKLCLYVCTLCLLCSAFCSLSAQAFSLGETYNQGNAQELEGVAISPVVNWVKKGDFIIKTGKLNFDFKLEQRVLDLSEKNAGKYDIDDKGYAVDKSTGKVATYICGMPFPHVDGDTPGAAEKIMENMKYNTYRTNGLVSTANVMWITRTRMERQVVAASKTLFYQSRSDGPFPNSENFLYQTMTFVIQPMDLRGSVSMAWAYNEDKLETSFAYVPMLRRVRRTSPASRSDPFLGSDFCVDDNYLWNGKNQTMTFKFLDRKNVLVPFTSPDKFEMKDLPDGSVERKFLPFKIGFELPDWKGAAWAPVDIIWTMRDVYAIEAVPKDPYYNYGRMVYYVDAESYYIYYKEIYDRSGSYWKTAFMHGSEQIAPSGRVLQPSGDGYCCVDDKADHATYARITYEPSLETNRIYVGKKVLGPNDFNLSALQQLTK